MPDEEGRNEPIGKTSSPQRDPNRTSVFLFWVKNGVRINPFDFVVAEHIDGSKTVGIVDEIFAYTDSDSHLANYIGSELGEPTAQPNVDRVSTMVARARVLRNMRSDNQEELYMPIPAERKVYFADENAIQIALGNDQLFEKQRKRKVPPIPAGLILQSNGMKVPVYLDPEYIVGPEGAHANATGISGLATKTSYLMFLIYSIYKKLENVSVVIFNVKHSDLLHIDEEADDLTEQDMEMYKRLGLDVTPFKNVTYFLPRGEKGEPDSDEPPRNYKLYAYALQDVYDSLDLLFAEVPDPQFTIDAFVRYVRDNWQHGRVVFEGEYKNRTYRREVKTWEELRNVPDDVLGVSIYGFPTHSTPPRIKRELRRLTSYSIFVNNRSSNEVYLGEAVRNNIKAGHISVIDIYRVPSINWPFIIGDVMRNIEQLYRETELKELPHLLIFIDELNTFAPAGEREPNPVTEQIIEIARKGRARRTALFGAQQFKSEVHRQVWGNCTLHVIGRTGSAELRTAPYGELDEYTKNQILNLRQGEVVLSFKVWRYPIKVIFPRPPYRIPARG